jgi:CubicO group peptidase (beta-lactamase class C family)
MALGFAQAAPAGQVDTDAHLAAIVRDPVSPLAGLSVLVLRDGTVLHQAQFGQRRIDGARSLPVKPDTLFRMASVSKLVVAVGAMRLAEQGRLDLDADIGPALGFAVRNPHFPTTPITARMLLAHTSSLRDGAGYSFEPPLTLRAVLALAHGPASAAWASASSDGDRAPGRYFSYANLNWGLLASVMEVAAGERFDRLMQREVFAPLGIRAVFDPAALSPAERRQLAVLYRRAGPAGAWQPTADDFGARRVPTTPGLAHYRLGSNGTLFSPQGGLRASLPELAKLMQMLIDGGRAQGREFLRPETVALLLSEQWRLDPVVRNGDDYHGLFRAW